MDMDGVEEDVREEEEVNDEEIHEFRDQGNSSSDEEGGVEVDQEHLFDYALEENDNREFFENHARLADYGTNLFPYFDINAVIFPEQELPLIFPHNEADKFHRIIASARGDGFIVIFPERISACQTVPFVATLCTLDQANNQALSVKMRGVYRCKVLELNLNTGEANVQKLPEVELPPILGKMLPKYANSLSISEKQKMATMTSGYPFYFLRNITDKHVNKCAAELQALVGGGAVHQALSRGLPFFSYFVARNMSSNMEIEYSILKENSANTRIATAAKYCRKLGAVCSECESPVFRSEHILRITDPTMNHVNAHGIVHRITLVSQLENFRVMTRPSFEFTWFPGYAWVILQCAYCGQHLGWEYQSETRNPRIFYGIQREGVKFCRDHEDDD
ncbi:unnamed protein product [Caenorhabditis sp. 36 PRJEB53466]|nr:unnamed protein product [Caenorhabditis sp. 36 PRJEB53466]